MGSVWSKQTMGEAVEEVRQDILAPGSGWQVLVFSVVKEPMGGSVCVWHACERRADGRRVVAVCVLEEQAYAGQRGVSRRDMDEGEGPYYWGCPKAILDAVPLDASHLYADRGIFGDDAGPDGLARVRKWRQSVEGQQRGAPWVVDAKNVVEVPAPVAVRP